MCAYNRVNGVYASQHRWLLTEVLRGEWGFDGLVVSDWGAVHDRVAALRRRPGPGDAAEPRGQRRGDRRGRAGRRARRGGPRPAVRRVLQLVDRAGAARPRPRQASTSTRTTRWPGRSPPIRAVLLKNDGGVLPLARPPATRVAVIGEFARTPRYQGAGSSQVNPTRVDVPLDELCTAVRLGRGASAAGFGIGATENDERLAAEAVELAARADTVVAVPRAAGGRRVRGLRPHHIDLPDQPDRAGARLAAANPNWWWCSPTAPRSGCRTGSSTRRRSWSAGCPGSRITNRGDRPGKEVVQLYVGDPEAAVTAPVRELKAFAKVDLGPGESNVVTFRLSARDLSYWSTRTHRWVLEGGGFELAVGASFRDLRLTTTVDVEAPPLRVPLDGSAALEEWPPIPTAAPSSSRRSAPTRPASRTASWRRGACPRIGNFPLNRLAAFPGMGITHDTVRAITRAGVDARTGGSR